MKGLKFILAALGLILIVLFSYQVVFANEQSCDCENDQDCNCDSDSNQSCDCDLEEVGSWRDIIPVSTGSE